MYIVQCIFLIKVRVMIHFCWDRVLCVSVKSLRSADWPWTRNPLDSVFQVLKLLDAWCLTNFLVLLELFSSILEFFFLTIYLILNFVQKGNCSTKFLNTEKILNIIFALYISVLTAFSLLTTQYNKESLEMNSRNTLRL